MCLKYFFTVFHFLGYIFYDCHIVHRRVRYDFHCHIYSTNMNDTGILPYPVLHSQPSLVSSFNIYIIHDFKRSFTYFLYNLCKRFPYFTIKNFRPHFFSDIICI